MPLYLKSHSQGEYVFDHSWAHAYERAGGRYYPKLQCAAPFTPATGPRLITRADADRETAELHLIGGATTLCDQLGASSLHITFLTEGEWARLGRSACCSARTSSTTGTTPATPPSTTSWRPSPRPPQDHPARAPRRPVRLEIVALTGPDITEEHWDAFFRFYMDTGSRKWGRPYLNRLFFSLIGERMADRILLVLARRSGRWIAGALNFIGGDCLYGRNWGAIEDVPFLHFELCYYQAIDYAIAHGLARVEAGAQGQHKIARGYLPSPVYSAHYIADPGLREPIKRYLSEEAPGGRRRDGLAGGGVLALQGDGPHEPGRRLRRAEHLREADPGEIPSAESTRTPRCWPSWTPSRRRAAIASWSPRPPAPATCWRSNPTSSARSCSPSSGSPARCGRRCSPTGS
jgi:predicted N-acyltransferase